MNWIKKNFLSTFVILISCIIGFLILEGLLRLFKNEWDVIREANILRNFKFTYEIGNLYGSKISQIRYERNQYGLRDDCLNIKQIEILTIGGSTTDQRYVPFENTYQKVLQERLRIENPNFGCVTNGGIDGHSTWGHIFAFENWFPLIPDLKPKYVLLYVGINDAFIERTYPLPGYDIENNHRKDIKTFFKKFEIVQKLLPIYRYYKTINGNNKITNTRGSINYSENDYVISKLHEKISYLAEKSSLKFKNRFQRILKYVDELGAVPICISQPHFKVIKKNGIRYGLPGGEFSGLDYDYLIRKINFVMKEICKDNYLDLYNYNFSKDHFYDTIHSTPKGSVEIGNAMANFIIEKYY